MKVAGLEWDEANGAKCRKHGVSPASVEQMFRRPIAVFPDPSHSRQEERFKAIGTSDDERSIFVAFTLRTRRALTFIRPISARYMHKKEIDHYEKEAAAVQKRR